MVRSLAALAALATLLAPAAPAASAPPAGRGDARLAGDWVLFERGGRDYVTVDNIARFYGLAPDAIVSRGGLALSGGRRRLEMMSEDGREIYLNGVRHWLSFPALDDRAGTLISRTDLVKTIEPVLRPERIAALRPCTAVVLDAGHGGDDRGARSAYGWEKDYTLDVARRIVPLLERAGIAAVLARAADVHVPLEQRAAEAARRPGSVFVSLHFNAGTRGSRTASGLEVYALTPRDAPSTVEDDVDPARAARAPGNAFDGPSMALAALVHRAILRRGTQFDRGVKRARFAVLREAAAPSILVEAAFLSNRDEALLVDAPAWRAELAKAIVIGLFQYQRLCASGAGDALLAERAPDRPAEPRAPLAPGPSITIRPGAN